MGEQYLLQRRKELFEQLIESERTFARRLNQLDELQEEFNKKDILPKDAVLRLFQKDNLKPMLLASQQLLKSLMDEVQQPDPSFASVFTLWGPYARVYLPYGRGYAKALNILTSAQNNSRFTKIINAKLKEGEINDVLAAPTARFSEYIQIIEDAADSTSKGEAQTKLLTILETLRGLATQMETETEKTLKVQKVSIVARQIQNCPIGLVRAGRTLEKEGNVSLLGVDHFGSLEQTKMYMFIFSDLALLAKPKSSSQYVYHSLISFSEDTEVKEILKAGDVTGFFLSSLDGCWTIGVGKYACGEWYSCISHVVQDFVARRSSLNTSALQHNPDQRNICGIRTHFIDFINIKEKGNFAYTDYIIKVMTKEVTYLIYRRFSDFLPLHQVMESKYAPHIKIPALPSKALSKQSEQVITQRKVILETLITHLLSHPVLSIEVHLIEFLSIKDIDLNRPPVEDEPNVTKATEKNALEINNYLLSLIGKAPKNEPDKYKAFDKYTVFEHTD